MKRHATESDWDKILAKQVSNKRYIPRIYKELLKIMRRQIKMSKRYLTKKYI